MAEWTTDGRGGGPGKAAPATSSLRNVKLGSPWIVVGRDRVRPFKSAGISFVREGLLFFSLKSVTWKQRGVALHSVSHLVLCFILFTRFQTESRQNLERKECSPCFCQDSFFPHQNTYHFDQSSQAGLKGVWGGHLSRSDSFSWGLSLTGTEAKQGRKNRGSQDSPPEQGWQHLGAVSGAPGEGEGRSHSRCQARSALHARLSAWNT